MSHLLLQLPNASPHLEKAAAHGSARIREWRRHQARFEMSFASSAPKLDRNEYPLELKKILRILEKRMFDPRACDPMHEAWRSASLIAQKILFVTLCSSRRHRTAALLP